MGNRAKNLMHEYDIQNQFARHKVLIAERQKDRLIAAAQGRVVSLRPARRLALLAFIYRVYNLIKRLYNRPLVAKPPEKANPILKS